MSRVKPVGERVYGVWVSWVYGGRHCFGVLDMDRLRNIGYRILYSRYPAGGWSKGLLDIECIMNNVLSLKCLETYRANLQLIYV